MIVEEVIQWLADALAYVTLAIILYGIWRGTQRRAGRMMGSRARWLGIPWFYLITTVLFIALCYVGWRALPVRLEGVLQGWLFAIGAVLYFPGMLLVLWGRLELGHNYLASGALGVRLFENHQLVVTGPYAIVRHPMYLGLMLAALGSVPMYFTWTTLFFAAFAPMLLVRAHLEERVLGLEFGEAWIVYCERVPMLIPRILLPKRSARAVEHAKMHRTDVDWQK